MKFWISVALVLGLSIATAAQSPPPTQGTVALEGTMKKFYRAANTIVVATIDGVEHVFRFAKDLVVHGGKHPDGLEGLREGTTVVVHYTVDGTSETAREIDEIEPGRQAGDQGDVEGLKIAEGVVTRIGRGRTEITVRFDNGTTERFRLTDRAAAEVAGNPDQAVTGNKVVVYYSDEAGRKIAHFFRKAS